MCAASAPLRHRRRPSRVSSVPARRNAAGRRDVCTSPMTWIRALTIMRFTAQAHAKIAYCKHICCRRAVILHHHRREPRHTRSQPPPELTRSAERECMSLLSLYGVQLTTSAPHSRTTVAPRSCAKAPHSRHGPHMCMSGHAHGPFRVHVLTHMNCWSCFAWCIAAHPWLHPRCAF